MTNFINRVIFPPIVILVALATAMFGGFDADTDLKRATIHAIVALVFAAELASMLVRTRRDQWDNLAIWMALVRIGVVHYFTSMALNFGGFAEYPDEWFSTARFFLGATGVVAFSLLAREDVRVYRGMDKRRKIIAGSVFGAIVFSYFLTTLIW